MLGGQASLGRSPPPECPEELPVTTRQHATCPPVPARLVLGLLVRKSFLTASGCRLGCPLFICSIREVPSDVNGLPDGEHVQAVGTEKQTQGAEPGHRGVHIDMFCSLETSA